MNPRKTLPVLALAGAVFAVQAHEAHESDEHRQHGAHQHGVAHLDVALEGQTLQIELTSPAMNIVGFEHHPSTDEQRQAVAGAAQTLEDAPRVFTLPEAAGCSPVMAAVESELLDDDEHDHDHEEGHDHEEDHGHEHQEGEMHSEFTASYRFDCTAPGELDGLEVRLFELFPGTEEIEAQVVGPNGQAARTLTAAGHRLAFPE